ncbi:MAG: DNA primase noncatalytic subunit PriX [Nitrososphaerota archaeon]|nr:DNA primase noncatalytic subunit PriX [Nitrososphaerota archaeon]
MASDGAHAVSSYDLARYPFVPAAEAYLREIGFTIEDAVAPSLVSRARERILLAIAKKPVDVLLLDKDREIISFYVSMIIVKATASPWLERRYSKAEGERARDAFKKEDDVAVCRIMNQLFGLKLDMAGRLPWRAGGNDATEIKFHAPLQVYLRVTEELQQLDNPRFSLVDNTVHQGRIYLTRGRVMDFVQDQFAALVLQRLRKMPAPAKLPEPIASIVADMAHRIPKPRFSGESSRFNYVEKVLQANVQDGRHRIVWMILPPYLVNVKHLSDEEAFDIIKKYVDKVGWKEQRADRLIRYNIRRARRISLMPPTLERLAQTSPSLHKIITDSISGSAAPG